MEFKGHLLVTHRDGAMQVEGIMSQAEADAKLEAMSVGERAKSLTLPVSVEVEPATLGIRYIAYLMDVNEVLDKHFWNMIAERN